MIRSTGIGAVLGLAILGSGCSAADDNISEPDSDVGQASDAIVFCGSGQHLVCDDFGRFKRRCWCETNPTGSLSFVREVGVQPGWVRATFDRSLSGGSTGDVDLVADVTCDADTSRDSVTVEVHPLGTSRVAVDVRANLPWLAANKLPRPCRVTDIKLTYAWRGTVLAAASAEHGFQMDLPLSHLRPSQLPPITDSTVSLRPPASARRHIAYPPQIVAVRSRSGRTALIEVEELMGHGTVGLRALAAYWGDWLDRELGGGAEIFPNWGIDVDRLGITKVTSGVEESHPGFDKYAYSGSSVPAIHSGDKSLLIYPAPPLHSEATYIANVLDNRGVPRCDSEAGCLDVIYDADAKVLRAVNGATLRLLDDGPVQPGVYGPAAPWLDPWRIPIDRIPFPRIPVPFPDPPGPPVPPILRSQLNTNALLQIADTRTAAPQLGNTTVIADAINPNAAALNTSVAPLAQHEANTAPLDRLLNNPSPQELKIAKLATKPIAGPLFNFAMCALNDTNSAATMPLTKCGGYSSSSQCSTLSDSLPIDSLPAAPGTHQLSLSHLMPYFAGRTNYMGTCGSHAFTQYYEALINRLADDLASKRAFSVDGEKVIVPAPRVAYSVSGGLVDLYTWGGTKSGDPDLDPTTAWPTESKAMPQFLEAYWPAREGDWSSFTWTPTSDTRAREALQRCTDKGFWFSGYCVGQGSPPPGAYWNYSAQVANFGTNPLADGIWSLANTYFDLVSEDISLADRDQGIQDVIKSLREGLPVQMDYASSSQGIGDGAGGTQSLLSEMTWFLPPELEGCDRATLDATFKPGGGHAVNIIGFSIAGSATKPNPTRSYFIIENNWGKDAGKGGFYTMNFAAFKYLAWAVRKHRLKCDLPSVACSSK